MLRLLKCFMILAVWVCGSAWPPSALAMNQILNIRHWVAPDHTRVVIDTTDDCRFTVEKGERTVAVDLDETAFPSRIPNLLTLNKPGVEGIAVSPRPGSGVRVSLIVPPQVQTTVFKLKEVQDKPYRIVIDIVLPEVAEKESESRGQVKTTRKDRIVVIDPGHGGESVGAVGKGGAFEKDVVLSISRKLRDALNARSGYRAFLTRDGDYYVSFKKRLMIAREYGADIFISIHADAAKNRTAGGSSVYCISTGRATSEAAKILARNENLADVIGGVPNGEGGEASDPIILDLIQTDAINRSRTLGGGLLRYLEGENRLKFPTVQEAPFVVLKLPDIPSVLIETAFISNPKEERLLKSGRFQTRIAEGIARSVEEFLPPVPLAAAAAADGSDDRKKQVGQGAGEAGAVTQEGGRTGAGISAVNDTAPAPVKAGKPRPAPAEVSRYRVKKGDTLEIIARRHQTSVAILMKLNRIKLRDPLLADRVLKIPAQDAGATTEGRMINNGKRPPAMKKGPVIYRVRKGDTLEGIARRHGTTVRLLSELNHLKPAEPLFVDRKLILSRGPAL
ncbi:MAG: N-acetylmuramoyl-L-alanine amidase [Syntrophales bacterium]